MAKRPAKTATSAGAPSDDTARLDLLERSGGFLTGMDGGRPAVRILGTDDWHATLREAIDALHLRGGDDPE
jgi:hypothetical protein